MGILTAVLIAVEVIVSFLLIVIILIQKTKSEGLGLAFGSGMGETLFGSRAGNVLTRITVVLGALFLANTLVLGVMYSGNRGATSIMSGAAPMSAPQQPARTSQGSEAPVGGAPTLPGAPLDDQGAAAAPVAPPVVETAPVAAPAEMAPAAAPAEAAPANAEAPKP